MKNKITILVTTDFSTNSRAGIRFAIQLASQMPCKLVFYHAIELSIPTIWSHERAAQFTETEIEKSKVQLQQFIKDIYKQAKMLANEYEYAVEMGVNVDNSIINYAQKMKVDYICMSTRGAGVVKKLIGTNASTLVNTSSIPVIVVPQNYRIKPITKVGYSSDFENIDKELSIVKAFTASLDAKIDVYHFHYQFSDENSQAVFKGMIDKYQSEQLAFHMPKLYLEYSLVENLQHALKNYKPSILIMFTKQKQNWFERFVFDSKTADMTYNIKVPLLAIRK